MISVLGIVEGSPAPPPSSKISRSFDLAWNPCLESQTEKHDQWSPNGWATVACQVRARPDWALSGPGSSPL